MEIGVDKGCFVYASIRGADFLSGNLSREGAAGVSYNLDNAGFYHSLWEFVNGVYLPLSLDEIAKEKSFVVGGEVYDYLCSRKGVKAFKRNIRKARKLTSLLNEDARIFYADMQEEIDI